LLAVVEEEDSESSGGQRLNDSQRATSLAGHTALEAEEMLKIMEMKHKYKSVMLPLLHISVTGLPLFWNISKPGNAREFG